MEALPSHINGIVTENGVNISNKCDDQQPTKNGYHHQNGYINGLNKKDLKNGVGNGCEMPALNGLTNGHAKGNNNNIFLVLERGLWFLLN